MTVRTESQDVLSEMSLLLSEAWELGQGLAQSPWPIEAYLALQDMLDEQWHEPRDHQLDFWRP